MPNLAKKQKRIVDLANAKGNDRDLLFIQIISDLEDKLDAITEVVKQISPIPLTDILDSQSKLLTATDTTNKLLTLMLDEMCKEMENKPEPTEQIEITLELK